LEGSPSVLGAFAAQRKTSISYAELPSGARPRLQRELESRGFHVPAMESELNKFGVFRSRSKGGVFLDIFNAIRPLGEAILDRRAKVVIDQQPLWFATAEDIIVLKAFSDRERDFDDLVRLSSTLGSKLDKQYVEAWTARLDESIGGNEVSERFKRASISKKPR
jgi:hypothetical protein